MLTLDNVYKAKFALKNVIRKTDLLYAPHIECDNEVYLKTENLQITGSFKIRGAYYKISTLTEEDRARGVIACSAGNHAQGVALASTRNGVRSTIYIPSNAPISKFEATRSLGAEVVLIDGVYDDAYEAACRAVEETGSIFVHPFNDEDVIAGQGTIGLELMEEMPDLDAVVVPIGGGGLASGVAFTVKQLNPNCKVYGVQAEGAPSMYNWIEKGSDKALDRVSTFADGIAVKCPGDLTFDLCSKYLDGVVTVSDDETATAILSMMENQKLVSEGAGAVAVAAAMFNKLPIKGKKVACIVSGGNIDVTILSRVITRGLLTSGRETEISVELVDKPGQLRDVATIVANTGANVVSVNHVRGGENTDINGCYLRLGLETRNHEHLQQIRQALESEGYHLL
jgi:threonine dehydratase